MSTTEGNFTPLVSQGADEKWQPTKEADGKTQRTKATPEDVRYGWYQSTRELMGTDGPFNVHTFEQKNGKTFDVAGSKALNDMIVKQVVEGGYYEIRWMGLLPAKRAGGKPYHQWTLGEDKAQFKNQVFTGHDTPTPAAPSNTASLTSEKTDDLPF